MFEHSRIVAKISDTEGVCLEGRWKGWLFRKHADGQWVSVRKLELEDPSAADADWFLKAMGHE